AARRALLEVFDVVAGGKRVTGPGQQDDADGGIVLRRVERGDEAFIHGAGEGVLLLRPIEADFHHAVGGGVDEFFGHAGLPFRAARYGDQAAASKTRRRFASSPKSSGHFCLMACIRRAALMPISLRPPPGPLATPISRAC